MSRPTEEDLMQVFHFTALDLEANRHGQVTTRQKVRLLSREGALDRRLHGGLPRDRDR
jgi:hypothetical protein